MAYVKVDPTQLDALAGRVSDARTQLFGDWGWSAGLPVDVQTPRLHGQLDGFWSNWSDGLKIIGDELDECAARLRSAAAEYRDTDACVQTAMTPDPRPRA